MKCLRLFFYPAALVLLFAAGCDSAYYKTMETFGRHKRDIMVDRVEEARDAQTEAKEQFVSALEQFSSVVNFQGGDLEEKYNKLNGEFQESQSKADAVSERISDVKSVSDDLFKEWQKELDQYHSQTLRRSSEQTMRETRNRYDKMIAAMESAEENMQPVLNAFGDQVLFLKHNLNARAIASLQDELSSIENDINVLVQQMEQSIDEANAFIDQMTQETAE